MNLRTTLGATALAGALLVGGAAPALAADPPADPPSRACIAARHLLHDLRVVNRHVNRDIRRLEAAIARAQANGHDHAAEVLQARLDRLEARQDRVVARVQAAATKVRERCGPADAPAT